MRRRLVLAAAAITTTIVLAFAIPLGLLIRSVANDKGLTTAERSAQALAPVLATETDAQRLTQVIRGLNDPAAVMSVVNSDATVLGAPTTADAAIDLARKTRRSFSTAAPGGRRELVPVDTPNGTTAVISVFVPTSVLNQGVSIAWVLLGAVSVMLVAVSVAVADRLARTVVTPVRALARTAEHLGQGDLDARVIPAGPPEIVEVGHVLNRLAERIGGLLSAEREIVADLSHRLRTPITALRLDADGLRDDAERERMTDDVDGLARAVDRLINDARRPVTEGMATSSDLAEITRDRLQFWSALAEEQGRSFETDLPPGPCVVSVGRGEMTAALDALLGNILAHTPDGTGFKIRVGASPRGAGSLGSPPWLLIVDDDGPGFLTGEMVERGTSGAGSTGLGLDIVRRTAERAGGSMTIGRSATGGARITVTLPRPVR